MQQKGATGEKKTFSTPETDLRIKFYKKTKTKRKCDFNKFQQFLVFLQSLYLFSDN